MGLTSVLIWFCALLSHPVQVFSETLPDPYTLTLSWGDSSPSPEVTGYRVYYGTESGTYTSTLDIVDNLMTASVSGLLSGATYYFAVTAVNADGLESDYSNEASYIPGARMRIQGVSGGQFMLTVTGTASHSYDIEATQDFSAWTVIGTETLDAGGSLDFTDPNAADFPQRFYRTRDTQP